MSNYSLFDENVNSFNLLSDSQGNVPMNLHIFQFDQSIPFVSGTINASTISNTISTNGIFSEIKNEINKNSELISPLENELITLLEEKYCTELLNEQIGTFKKKIIDLFNNKCIIESKYFTNRSKYDELSKNLLNTIKIIELFPEDSSKNNSLVLINSIKDSLNDYYCLLDLKNLKEQYSDVLNEISFIKETLKNMCTLQSNIVCPICLEGTIKYYLDPCGHTICNNCKELSTRNGNNITCFLCRTKINSFKKLFLEES